MCWYSSHVTLWLPIRNSVALLCALALTVPPVEARTKKGDKLLKLGAQAEARKDYDAALAYYDQAVRAANHIGDQTAEAYALLRKSFVALYGVKLPEATSTE